MEPIFNFSEALRLLKNGIAVTREGWNGKGMYVYMVPAGEYPSATPVAKKAFGNGMVPYRAYLALKTADGSVGPWSISNTDALAEDWVTAEI